MAQKRSSIRLDLTPEQRQQVRQALGKEAQAIDLTVEELEERIAPISKEMVP